MTFTTIQDGLQQFAAAFTLQVRNDGTKFLKISDEWLDLMRVLHCEEMPNDWRYETAYDLAHAFLQHAEPSSNPWCADDYYDIVTEITDSQVDCYDSDVLNWLAAYPGRAEFSDPDAWSFECNASILERARARQQEVIEEMAYHLISYIDENLSA